jgi:hypothetical protein
LTIAVSPLDRVRSSKSFQITDLALDGGFRGQV